jgi:hypothetical protein
MTADPRRIQTIAAYRVVPSACLRVRMVATLTSEVTSYSCRLYFTSATQKFPLMSENPAETRREEKPTKIGISHRNNAEKIDRRISVALMMDWTDEVELVR